MPDQPTVRTRTLHAGHETPLGNARPNATPLHLATAYSYPETSDLDAVFADNNAGYVYSRYGNPTVRAFEEAVAISESTETAISYASGMAAIHAVLIHAARSGGSIVASRDVYGATDALLRAIARDFDIDVRFVEIANVDDVRRAIDSTTRLVYAETISNPLIRVADIPGLAAIAHQHGALLAIDNTFASPVVVNPAVHGADFVIHSSTKFIGGHGDTTGGVIAVSRDLAGPLREQAKLVGGMSGPFDAWLALRGLRTLHVRVREQCRNAATLRDWLAQDSRIDTVYFPSLDDPAVSGTFNDLLLGSLLAFEIRGANSETIFSFFDALELCIPATTLGDVCTLVLHPATSSHRPLTQDQRAAIGIRDNLVRISVGIEDVHDVIADIDNALSSVGARSHLAASAAVMA